MSTTIVTAKPKLRVGTVIAKDFKRNYFVYFLVIPVVAYYLIFCYWPMYGLQIAFKDFNLAAGYMASPWADPWYKYFLQFFNGPYFGRTLRNTLLINIYGLLFTFPLSILFALLLNEVRSSVFKRTVQTISYLPYFISMVVLCGIINDFCLSDGLINSVITMFGGKASPLLSQAGNFRTIYIASDIWQYLGWNSIIYFAALSGIDQELYQAAIIDGAGRFRQMWHITLPGLKPTIVILLILSFGSMMSVGAEKIILLYNPATYETADVISSYVYRSGLQKLSWSYGAAVGMFNSVINVILLVIANQISRRVGETSLCLGATIMKMKKSAGEYVFDITNYMILGLWAVITVYPLLFVLFSSVSDAGSLMAHRGLLLYPLGFDLTAYKLVLQYPLILSGYMNTFIIVVGGTLLNLVMSSLAAYFLSRKNLFWKKAVMVMITITMFFSGGLIPTYLLVSNTFGMRDTLLALIVPGAISSFNVIVMRTSFMNIPDSLTESAYLDGANDLQILARIVIPLSKAILAVMALWYGVAHWNSWFSAAIYLNDRKLFPIQLILREILIQNSNSTSPMVYQMTTGYGNDEAAQVAETIKYAAIIIATVPILCVYPFLQKHFVKGVMIGALKG